MIAEPAASSLSRQPQDYVERVRHTHERGGFGSTGSVLFSFTLRLGAGEWSTLPAWHSNPSADATACTHEASRNSCACCLLRIVKHMRQEGSIARMSFWRRYGSHWKVSEAEKNLLRTHTTAVSSRMLYRYRPPWQMPSLCSSLTASRVQRRLTSSWTYANAYLCVVQASKEWLQTIQVLLY